MDKNKFIIILVGFLDVLSMGIVIPTLPELVKFYSVSPQMISYGVAVYALCALLATSILGQLSDIYGRKKILLLCVIGSFISSLIIPIYPIYLVFLIARAVNGITGGNISILQSIISDISKSKEERAKNMGIIGAIFGGGFIFGPLFGAILLHFGPMMPYWFMAVFSLVEVFIIWFLFSETNEHIHHRKIKFNLIKQLVEHLKIPRLNYFMISFFLLVTAFYIYQSVLPLYLSKHYGVSGSFSGYVMATSGLVLALNQGLLMGRFWLKKFNSNQLIFIINISLLIFYLLLTIVEPLYLFVGLLILLLPFRALLNPVYQSEIIEYTEVHKRGEIMGVLTSLQSLAMFIGPLLGGLLLEKNISIFGFSAIFIIISIIFVAKIVRFES
ncbi:MFS transporter [Candidatus Gracilibacteria bacterium]|nr:MFS transporter [Candidatus Gracilibacteria bacterium]